MLFVASVFKDQPDHAISEGHATARLRMVIEGGLVDFGTDCTRRSVKKGKKSQSKRIVRRRFVRFRVKPQFHFEVSCTFPVSAYFYIRAGGIS